MTTKAPPGSDPPYCYKCRGFADDHQQKCPDAPTTAALHRQIAALASEVAALKRELAEARVELEAELRGAEVLLHQRDDNASRLEMVMAHLRAVASCKLGPPLGTPELEAATMRRCAERGLALSAPEAPPATMQLNVSTSAAPAYVEMPAGPRGPEAGEAGPDADMRRFVAKWMRKHNNGPGGASHDFGSEDLLDLLRAFAAHTTPGRNSTT